MNEAEKQEYIAYLSGRRSSARHNYHKECLKVLEQYRKNNPGKRPKVLLHACCVVCACWPLDFLYEQGCDITVFYSNTNIWPKEEYDHRLSELKRYLHERWNDEIPLVEDTYDYENYEKTVLANRGTDPEGWKSCFACYAYRIAAAAAYAQDHGFDYFSSVLTFSRQKDSEKINEIGLRISEQFENTQWLVSDYKKADGARKSDMICNQYDLYRQDYCGCRYSFCERHPQNESKHA